MRSLTLSAVALCVTTTIAYRDTSPFFLFSTSSHFETSSTSTIEQSSRITKDILGGLSSCPTKHYIFVSQPGVSVSDYRDSKNIPTLSSIMQLAESGLQSTIAVSDVLGSIDAQKWKDMLLKKCKASSVQLDTSKDTIPSLSSSNLIEVVFTTPSKNSRSADLKKNDAYLASVIDQLSSSDYTVLYTTGAISAGSVIPTGGEQNTQYEMEHPLFDIPHTELKRDLSAHKRQEDNDDDATLIDGPLFDRYQFFTPGIWMGFSATLILVAILYVGISAIAGLQVTYAAFEKENGPLASKKAQ